MDEELLSSVNLFVCLDNSCMQAHMSVRVIPAAAAGHPVRRRTLRTCCSLNKSDAPHESERGR